MKTYRKLSTFGVALCLLASMASCSDDKDEPENNNTYLTTTIGFKMVPLYLMGGPTSYGNNLYYGAQDQITTGYMAPLSDNTYVQFPINYGLTYDADFNQVWGYSFFNGGLAVANYHDMTEATYMNQLSVYNTSSPSGGNFLVAFSSSTVLDISNATFSDYSGCAKVYITDEKGYYVKNPGTDTSVTGDSESAYFDSVYINNTTYDFLTMKNGNNYANALNEENQGWFKVQFIAFDDDDPNAMPVGHTEAYLANFRKGLADDYYGIIDTWTEVDLSMLPECSILVINFAGSDVGEYGLNTPGYCALDNFKISVKK